MSSLRGRRLGAVAASAALVASVVSVAGISVGAGAAPKVPGVTAKQITIGATVPLTGIASFGYSDVAKAANAVFKWVNHKGGIWGRKIKYVTKDDCYDTPGAGCTGVPNTVTQTHALLSIPVFATVGSLGTPTQDSVRSLLNSQGVPQLFVNSGSRDWNNPGVYPDLFGWQPSYNEEGKIFAKYINATYPGASVCYLGQNDDFGTDGLSGLVAGGINPTVIKFYDVPSLVLTQGASIAPYIAAFQSAKCTVTVLDTIPGATDAALGASLALAYSPHWIISSVGSDPVTVWAGLNGKVPSDPELGAVSFDYLPATTDPTSWNAWMVKVLLSDKADFPNFTSSSPLTGNMEYGLAWGVAFVEALRANGKTLTRASFLKTLTHTTFANTPSLLPLRYSPSDHQGLNGGYLVTIASETSTSPVSTTIYQTDSTPSGPVKVATKTSGGIPSWLK
ncbi:MAG TPA: ABC transporter substrate-binding protein [Acidimicrobiales bacterium]|nr:ABC transporter substrate-binding protein [Acidimicrobiales bacterium]